MDSAAVMNDLLYAFMGLDGKYVRARLMPPAPATVAGGSSGNSLGGGGGGPSLAFCIEGSLEPCLQEMAEKVLPIW